MAETVAERRVSHQHLRPDQCRAARGFLDWTQEELAHRADVSRSTVRDFEQGRHALQTESERRILAALTAAGIVLIAPEEGGPGVTLRPGVPRTGDARNWRSHE